VKVIVDLQRRVGGRGLPHPTGHDKRYHGNPGNIQWFHTVKNAWLTPSLHLIPRGALAALQITNCKHKLNYRAPGCNHATLQHNRDDHTEIYNLNVPWDCN
jgi:hypothetical protein